MGSGQPGPGAAAASGRAALPRVSPIPTYPVRLPGRPSDRRGAGMGREKRLRGSSWFCALLAAGAAAGCGSGQARFPCTDPLDCPGGPSSSNLCQKDSDCGDGICGSDGKCRDRYSPGTQQTACARVTCQPGYFCANGSCLLATAQCKPPDPACIYVPRRPSEPPPPHPRCPSTT